MTDSLTIPAPDEGRPALNYDRLREEGLATIERLAHRLWTDFNIHDPGITTLEILCYAITELGYRASFPIEDLLTDPARPFAPPSAPLYPAETIFPARPVTETDYRKLLVDIDGISNAWLHPAERVYHLDCARSRLRLSPPADGTAAKQFSLNGLFDVLLAVDATVDTADPEAMAPIIDSVRRRFHAHRNLGEDIAGIDVVPRKTFKLCADIELAAEADAERVEAGILLAVQAHLAPTIPFYSLEQMLGTGKSLDEILDGPLLANGFIDDADLNASALVCELRLSDIMGVVLDVPGVRAVREIMMLPAGQQALPADGDRWIVPVRRVDAPPVQPMLSVPDCNLRFFRDRVPAPTRHAVVTALMAELQAHGSADPASPPEGRQPALRGRVRDLAGYRSVRHHFPAAYGIGSTGLPPSATDVRRAQAKQLSAYLLFFDQILADFFAQLAHVRDLFSLEASLDRTYFTQTVAEAMGGAGVYVDESAIAETIQALTETPDQFLARRNAFLDHLLARFAENFSAYAWTMYVVDSASAPSDAMHAKRRFLSAYPRVSRDRGGAADLMRADALWDTDNVAGLARRLAGLLGIRNIRQRNLSEIDLDIYEERDNDDIHEYRFRIRDDSPGAGGKILLSGSWKHFDTGSAAAAMQRALYFAMDDARYDRKETTDGRFFFNVVDDEGVIVARRIEYFITPAARDSAINYLINLLHERYSDEGFFLIEHLLLRLPNASRDALVAADTDPAPYLLPVCGAPDCSDSRYLDPYSHRLSVVLPAWGRRFSEIDFRRFAEETIRRETPAHLVPRICWVNRQQMHAFEQALNPWLQAAFGGSTGDRDQALAELIAIFSQLRSVYPPAGMTPCEAIDADHPPFVLGRTMMGQPE